MSIANELIYLQGTKEAIRQAIIEKDVDVSVDDPFRSYADKILDIQGGGGGEAVKIKFDNYTDGENYLPYNENFKVIMPDEADGIFLRNHSIWEWNDTIYVGFGQITSNAYGNNKVHKFDKNTLEYIGSFTAGTVGIVCNNSDVYVYDNKAFFATGNTYPLNSSTATANNVLRILDLETEKITNGVTIPNAPTTYGTAWVGKWCFIMDNASYNTTSITAAYLIDLDTPTSTATKYTISVKNYGAKGIDYNNRYIFWVGGRATSAQTGVFRLDTETRVVTELSGLPTGNDLLKTLCNDNYFWCYDGMQSTAEGSNVLYQYDMNTTTRTTIELDYYINEPLAKNIQFNYKIKPNLYLRALSYANANNYAMNNNAFINTTEDNWYVDRKGILYSPFIGFGILQNGNAFPHMVGYWINEENTVYSTGVGNAVSTAYGGGAGALFTISNINKYITLNTPTGTRISIDGSAEFSPTSPTTRVKSPFTGYVKYGGSGGSDIEPEEDIPTESTHIFYTGAATVKVGGSAKTVTCQIFDKDDVEITDYTNYTFTWSHNMPTNFVGRMTITYPTKNQYAIKMASGDDAIGTEFDITVNVTNDITGKALTPDVLTLEVVELF